MTERIIDRFIPEEIEQIKKELGYETGKHKKSYIIGKSKHKLYDYVREHYNNISSKGSQDIQACILELTDLITENYQYAGSMTLKDRDITCEKFKRTAYIQNGIEEDYKRVYERLVDLFIGEHSSMKHPKISEKTEV